MATTNVLVLGNDPFINRIAFDKIHPSVITLGVNRIWLKHIPNYLFFHDWNIVLELLNSPEKLSELKTTCNIFSSKYLFKKNVNMTAPEWIKIYPILNPTLFPDSITNAINHFTSHVYNKSDITFYIAGASLTWQEPSHFWKELDYSARNSADSSWYVPRFKLMLNNFENLQKCGIRMVSVTPNSALNKIMRYEKIENLYV